MIFEELSKYAQSLLEAVEQLESLSGGKSIANNGKSLSDLKRQLGAVIHSDIIPLRSFAHANSALFYAEDPGVEIRLLSQRRLLELEVSRLDKLIDSYSHTLKQISSVESGRFESNSGVGQAQVATAQLDQALLETLLNLGSKVSSAELRDRVYEKRGHSIEQKLEIEKELEILAGNTNRYDVGIVQLLQESLEKTIVDVNSMQSELVGFMKVFRETTLASGSNLYMADTAPQIRGGFFDASKSLGLTSAVAIMLGLFLGVLFALVRSGLKNHGQAQSAKLS